MIERRIGDNGYLNLANAIIIQALMDYSRAKKNGGKAKASSLNVTIRQTEIEEFFKGRWYGVLSSVDPDYLLKRVNMKDRFTHKRRTLDKDITNEMLEDINTSDSISSCDHKLSL